jgi:hypothetical protein
MHGPEEDDDQSETSDEAFHDDVMIRDSESGGHAGVASSPTS